MIHTSPSQALARVRSSSALHRMKNQCTLQRACTFRLRTQHHRIHARPITCSTNPNSQSTNGHSQPANGHSQTTNGHAPLVDAILVLAGGFKSDGSLPPWVIRRLDVARDLHTKQAANTPIVCLGGGTPHKAPILDKRGYVVHEATMCAKYLLSKGVPPSVILKEISSYDTVGNTFFSLTIHALPAGWRRLAVVTSEFHMPRSKRLFQDMYGIASSSVFGHEGRFDLSFISASDEGLFDDETREARIRKEAKSLDMWVETRKGISSMEDLHAWLHSSHLCYAVERQDEFGVPTISDPKLLASY